MSRITAPLLIVLLLAGCGVDDTENSGRSGSGKPVVMTTFYPTAYFTERIAGDLVTVICPVPEGEDAIFWQPDEETISRYQKADLIVVNGADFAKWVATTPLPSAKIVNTAKPFESEFIRFEKATTHAHGPAGEHAHEGLDGHTWLDPVNAKVQAEQIKIALARLLPDHEKEIASGFEALSVKLAGLDRGYRGLTKNYGGGAILASHPAYNYVAKRYGWKLVNLDLDPGEMPRDEVFQQISEIVKETGAKFLLWEGDPKPEIAKRFSDDLSVTSVTFSPCELYEGEDYMTVMERNLANLQILFR